MLSPSPLAGEGQPSRSDGRVREQHKLLRDRARAMRTHPTEAERRLWAMPRDKRMPVFKFRRQQVIDSYIVDFVCLERRLIIEADGSQHAESDYDQRRDDFLAHEGFSVMRFWNNDVLNRASAVFDAIFAALTAPHPPTAARRVPPSPARGEGLGEQDG